MPVYCKLEFEYDTDEISKQVSNSLAPENAGYVSTEISGSKLIASIEAKSLDSLLHTLDDYLACLQVAEKILDE